MLRYVALATAIVLACLLALVSFRSRPSPETTPAPYSQSIAPAQSPGARASQDDATAAPLAGSAPWALSALPECFRQTREVRGTPAYVERNARDLTRASWRRMSRVRLATADCRLDVAVRSAVVVRGDTRLEIPPDARFYVAGRTLIVDRFASGVEDLRVYVLRDGKTPAIAAL